MPIHVYIIYGSFHATTAELSRCNRDHMAHKIKKNVYYLTLNNNNQKRLNLVLERKREREGFTYKRTHLSPHQNLFTSIPECQRQWENALKVLKANHFLFYNSTLGQSVYQMPGECKGFSDTQGLRRFTSPVPFLRKLFSGVNQETGSFGGQSLGGRCAKRLESIPPGLQQEDGNTGREKGLKGFILALRSWRGEEVLPWGVGKDNYTCTLWNLQIPQGLSP